MAAKTKKRMTKLFSQPRGNKHGKMKKVFLNLSLLAILFFSCSSHKQDVYKDVYDFHIQYSYQGIRMDENDYQLERLDSNNLYIILEGWFHNDTIRIEDGKHVIADNLIVTTEPSTGVATDFVVKDIAEIDHLTIKVNSSPRVSFEIARKDFFIIGIRKYEKEISVVFYKSTCV